MTRMESLHTWRESLFIKHVWFGEAQVVPSKNSCEGNDQNGIKKCLKK